MIVTRAISITNFAVATSALGFQVFVLYPWHKQLDDDFEELKREHLRVLKAIESTPAAARIQQSLKASEASAQATQPAKSTGLFSGLVGGLWERKM